MRLINPMIIKSHPHAIINLDNLIFNVNSIKKTLPKNIKYLAVVKANAYGHGAVEISKILEKLGMDYLAVARIDEAIELRNNDIKMPILLFGYLHEDYIKYAITFNIDLCIYDMHFALLINNLAASLNVKANIHIKVDTGMSRLGFTYNDEETIKDIINISHFKNINIVGLFSHFARADEESELNNLQLNRFNKIINKLNDLGINIPIKHIANSAAAISNKNALFNMARLGIGLYGLDPARDLDIPKPELKPVMMLKSIVASVKYINKGEGVSYGSLYVAKEDRERIITIPLGYADGFFRTHEHPKVCINNKIYPVIGRICMDYCMIKSDEELNVGDEVIIFGNDLISAGDISFDYEVLSALSRRVTRIYMKDNKEIKVINELLIH